MADDTRTSESCWAAVTRPLSSGGGLVYNMDDEVDRIRLEHDIWVKDPSDSLKELRAANSELVAVLESSISNQSKVTELFIENHVHHPKAVQRVAERRRGSDKVILAEGVPGTIASLIGLFSGSP